MRLEAPRPFVRWPGGKWKLGPQIAPHFPAVVSGVYREPFAGAAAMAWRWAIPRGYRVALSDTELALIDTYIAVRDHVDALVAELKLHVNDKAHFEAVRALYNAWLREPLFSKPAPLVTRAAWFIFLHKTCFNGLHRVDSQGCFNVAHGKFATEPKICDEALLRACSLALAGADLAMLDFETATLRAGPGDMVYFDPPYDGTWTGYQAQRWTDRDLVRLRDLCLEMDRRGVAWALSNTKTPRVLELFDHWRCIEVTATTSMSCDVESRGDRVELLIRGAL